jgi:sirohydrochlorin cobaltochelatase
VTDALVLLAHGSPDPDWMAPVEATAARVRARVPCPVVTATLEHGRGLAEAVAGLAAGGATRIAVVALLLSPGGRHFKRDIPAQVAAVQAAHPGLELRLAPGVLGMDAAVLDALAAAAVRAGLPDMS